MKKVNITICTGQNCYTKGATLFKQLDHMMGSRTKTNIALGGTDCPGYCATCGISQAPCAKVNGQLITQAGPAEVLQATRKYLV